MASLIKKLIIEMKTKWQKEFIKTKFEIGDD